jgi:aminoglycoside phosphotransferase (APT) family kinase protein
MRIRRIERRTRPVKSAARSFGPVALTPASHREFIAAAFPSLSPVRQMEEMNEGWDSYTYLVNETWIVQFPRPAAPPGGFGGQMRLLRRLKGKLPFPIPDPEFSSETPLCMGYRRIDGMPAARAARGEWPEQLGRFLQCLHHIGAAEVGLPPASADPWRKLNEDLIQEFRERVVPLLAPKERASAETLFAAFLDDRSWSGLSPALVHRDLGPAHILMTPGGQLAGVIDWGDAQLGDPAIDFSWLLFGSPAEGERALLAYGEPTNEALRRRARFYHQLGPWHEAAHGLDTAQPAYIASGLAGIRARLKI